MKDAIVDIETTGLDPLQCEIVAIGVMVGNAIKTWMRKNGESEEQMLREFWEHMQDVETIIGFNVIFDSTFLKLRSMKYGLKIKNFSGWAKRVDVRLLLNENRMAKGTRLKDYATFFGLTEADDDGISGEDVPRLWEEGKYDLIETHLVSDVKCTGRIWEIIKQCGLKYW